MDNALTILFSSQFILFCLCITGIVMFVRRIAEYVFPTLKTSKPWTDAILPGAPMVIGVIMSLVDKAYPYATGLTSTLDHVIYGVAAGLLSNVVYRIVKAWAGNFLTNLLSTMAQAVGLPKAPTNGDGTSGGPPSAAK